MYKIKGVYKIMELTLENVKKFKEDAYSDLVKEVCDYVILNWDNWENKKNIFLDVYDHGCENGLVPGLIYRDRVCDFYEEHKSDINSIYAEALNELGYKTPIELFGSSWDAEDPLALCANNQQLLVYYAYEEVAYKIGRKFGIE